MQKTIDDLLQLPYWIIDILPEQVPKDSPGQYFAVEKYFLEEKPKRRMIKDTTIGDRLRASITDLNALLDYMP